MSASAKDHVTLRFPGTSFPPVSVAVDAPLPLVLDGTRSPILFGCQTGICGTCLCEVEGEAPPPDDDERETLDVFAFGNPSARLACQLRVRHDLSLRALAWT